MTQETKILAFRNPVEGDNNYKSEFLRNLHIDIAKSENFAQNFQGYVARIEKGDLTVANEIQQYQKIIDVWNKYPGFSRRFNKLYTQLEIINDKIKSKAKEERSAIDNLLFSVEISLIKKEDPEKLAEKIVSAYEKSTLLKYADGLKKSKELKNQLESLKMAEPAYPTIDETLEDTKEEKIEKTEAKCIAKPFKKSEEIAHFDNYDKLSNDYFLSQEIFDEFDNLRRMQYCVINKIPLLVSGTTGSGKTTAVKAVLSLFPEKYTFRLDPASDKAYVYAKDKMNNDDVRILFIYELQQLIEKNNLSKEMIKNLADGEDFTYRTFKETHLIKGNRSIVTTIADSNKFKEKLDRDYEQLRKMFNVSMKDYSEHNQLAIREKNEIKNFGFDTANFDRQKFNALSAHMQNCINYTDLNVNKIFLPLLSDYIPPVTAAIAMNDMFRRFVDASFKFHSFNRVIENGQGYASLEDFVFSLNLCYPQLCSTLLEINNDSEDNLVKINEAVTKSSSINYSDWWEYGCRAMQTHAPHLFDKWAEKQIKDSNVVSINPITAQEEAICRAV